MLLTHLRSLFARDKEAFWWKYFTDEELELQRMDVWQLAAVIEEAKVRPGMEKRRIVAEHMLSQRIALIQAKASWGSGVLGFIGAVVGAALSVALAAVLKSEPTTPVPSQVAECAPVARTAAKPSPADASATPRPAASGAAGVPR